ncbi:MAG: ATP-binding protein [archaeon]
MANIKFIGRESEIKEIGEIRKGSFFLVVKGRRRIGKTTLLRRALPEAANIFVWPDKSLDWMLPVICQEHGLPSFRNFSGIVEYLLDNKKTVIIDEFQNFLGVDKSVFGELQKTIDERKLKGKPIKIAVAGSSYSLMNKVFNDAASPLYGRRTHEMTVDNLPIRELFQELKVPIEEFVKTWAVFEGVPYYYELLDKKLPAEKNLFRLLLSKEAQLQGEGRLLLSSEFGRESRTYGTVLTAISEGKTKLSEIASLFGNKKNEAIKYLDILRKEFRFVRKNTPITSMPEKSREGKYEIIDNFLSFWFFFAEKKRNYIEQERFEELEKFFKENFTAFVGKKFEKFVIKLIKSKLLLKEFPCTKIGQQWGKTSQEKGKNTYEIDIAMLNEETKSALFAECKWQENVNTQTIALQLAEKARHVEWHNNERQEQYAIFAKTFSKKITQLEGKKVHCISLKEIEKALQKAKKIKNPPR